MDEKKSFFELLDGKSAMIVGFVGGILIIGTIGFIVLGYRMFYIKSGGGVLADANNYGAGQPPAVQPNPSGQPPAPGAPVNVGVGHFPAKGNASAPVTVIEFADFRCPFCERFYGDAEKSVMRDYVAAGKVKYYFRHFAFLGQQSTWAAEAAECANEQGKFWQMHDWLYSNQAPESDLAYYSKDNLIKYAGEVGLNSAKFSSCLNSDKYAGQVTQDTSEGQAAGVSGTPTIFVNGVSIVGAQPYSVVKAAIDAALAKK